MEILCFFAGTAFYYSKSLYSLSLLGICLFFRQKLTYLWWFLAALLWGGFHQWWYKDVGMPSQRVIQQATVQGVITSIPSQTLNKTQFLFQADQLNGHPVKTTLWLSCYHRCPKLHAQQRLQLKATLKKPINLANPGGFDYVSWLNSRHIHWVGSVSTTSFHPLTSREPTYSILTWREQLANQLNTLIPDESILGIVQALTLGLNQYIDKAQWELFRLTGTTHLIDISGEHIAMIAGLAYWLSQWLWKRFGGLCLWYPAPKLASLVAMIIASFYALIAGFSVPTQRALIMCGFVLLRNIGNQRLSSWQAWRYALLGVLIAEPHSIFMLGFYFSFLAVVILILINQRIKLFGIRKLVILQCACLVGLMPLTLYWFSYGSLNGLLANLIAIPWVSFFIVPLALLITFLSPWAVIPGSVKILQWAVHYLLVMLQWIDTFFPLHFHFTFTTFLSPLALMAALASILILPTLSILPAVLILIMASLFPQFDTVAEGEAKIDILDVGQGLSAIIRTAHHTLVYDTGMKFFQGNDIGKLVIIPYLDQLGIQEIDKIVISHPDLDHRGGLASLEERFSVHELIVDDPRFYHRGLSCHQYPSWQWDGISFRFFPLPSSLFQKNNHSCILKVSNQTQQMLLTGDIERPSEAYLTTTYGEALASTLLLIPHHGSKTSSSDAFIHLVSPRIAIASYGFNNRYHFPHQQTLTMYQQEHIPIYNTVDCGMISLHLHSDFSVPKCYRNTYRNDSMAT